MKILKKVRNWEAWPFALIYAPLVPFWLYFSIRSKSFWFFTSSNPKITFGGMEGEPKKEMYQLLPLGTYPKTINILPSDSHQELMERIQRAGITFPFIVKPEIGGQGILFRKIDDEQQLSHYHSRVPVEYIVQEMIQYPMEVSVFYIRHPKESRGVITGFLHKIPLHVVGNGTDTLEQLVVKHPKGVKRLEEMKLKHQQTWHSVIPVHQKYALSYAANHNRGAQFIDLSKEIDDDLISLFDGLSIMVNDFFYGRYDIMCSNIADLKQGKNFSILEYNGCGAEPNHFYDTGYTLWEAYSEILFHWKKLYEISAYNCAAGIKPWPFLKGYRFLAKSKEYMRMIREADKRI